MYEIKWVSIKKCRILYFIKIYNDINKKQWNIQFLKFNNTTALNWNPFGSTFLLDRSSNISAIYKMLFVVSRKSALRSNLSHLTVMKPLADQLPTLLCFFTTIYLHTVKEC